MAMFKVPHSANGDHNPIEPEATAVYTAPYELKSLALKYICIEINRNCTHVVWEDIGTGKRYRSDTYLLNDILTTGIKELKSVTTVGCRLHIYGDFIFEMKGPHVLLTVKPEEESKPSPNDIIDYAVEMCRRHLDGKFTAGQLKKEMKRFIDGVSGFNAK